MTPLNKFLATTASRACGVAVTQGMKMGVELELEGPGVGLQDEPTRGWRRTADGSLRGESIEFVLSAPSEYPVCVKAVDYLFGKFGKNAIKFNKSIRTSTHVHLNFSDKPMRQAITFFCLFTLLEEILEHYSGEDRAGNLFCLSSRRTDEIAAILQQCLRDGNLRNFAGDRYKYAACNLSTLFKFGTVEVRTMRGADTAGQVNKWLSILNDMYIASLRIESPTDLVTSLSHEGAQGFLRTIFSEENAAELEGSVPEGFDFFRSLLDGARLIQPLAYEFEDAFRFRPDPNAPAPARERLLRISANGERPMVIRLSGRNWSITGRNDNRAGAGAYFMHEESCIDSRDVRWNQESFCFEEVNPDWDEDEDDEEDAWLPLEWVNNEEDFYA